MKKSDAIIQIHNLTKVFSLPHERYNTVKQHFVNLFNPKSFERFKALENVSFEIAKGEFFGIIGANGSGKSTLLKILAGIYQPTSGEVIINGSLSPFIELGVGFNPDLTARENIFLNAAVLGLSKKETESKFDQIIDFAELREFVDQKLKNFSSGMQVRLGFSIAIQAQTDILLVDEVLAVGDSNFQQKCFDVFYQLKKQGKTIIFVSHDLGSIEDFCDRVMILKNGRLKFIGSANQAILEYMKANTVQENEAVNKKTAVKAKELITKSECLDSTGKPKEVFEIGEEIVTNFTVKNLPNGKINFGVSIHRADNVYCFGTNTILDKVAVNNKTSSFKVKFTNPNLLPGSYYLVAAIFGETDKKILDFAEKVGNFKVHGSSNGRGVMNLEHSWEIK